MLEINQQSTTTQETPERVNGLRIAAGTSWLPSQFRQLASRLSCGSSIMDLPSTNLVYYTDMWKLQSTATVLCYSKGDDGRHALILDSTIFHPQGGGQPSDTGVICVNNNNSEFKFMVEDVRSNGGIVFHYGFVDTSGEDRKPEMEFAKGKEVVLYVDESRRTLNSRWR